MEAPKECLQGRKNQRTGAPDYAHGAARIVAHIKKSGLVRGMDIQLGVSRVFVKDAIKQNIIDKERYKTVLKFIVRIQSAIRRKLAMTRTEVLREEIRQHYAHVNKVAVKVQAVVRGMLVRRSLWDLRLIVLLRGALARRDVPAASAHMKALEKLAAALSPAHGDTARC